MPTLNLFTNVPVDAVIASDILKDATKAVAKIIGKPESYVMILINGGVPIAFAGTEEPAAYGELISIGGLGPSVNGKLSSTIAEILQIKLSIDSSRFYIKFYDVQVCLFDLSCYGLFLQQFYPLYISFCHFFLDHGDNFPMIQLLMKKKEKTKTIFSFQMFVISS
ncbi:uncharacterized protein LOC115724688 isoform X1 [Cannabis sativa]|uniref:uncharacterized protein LOC115724688 isoform X1 n=1 Tax=Cannabis sativa TaxID=3483 RepID=UPI0029CA09F3|nr:uncharacterized protein LOC115724688 isoform X1 [Cannabis sativa]